MKLNRMLIITLAGLSFVLPTPAQDNANSKAAEIESLKQEVQALEKRVNALEQHQSSQPQPAQLQKPNWQALAAAKSAPTISIGGDGFKAVSADTNFVMNIRGYVQLDSRTFFENAQPDADGFLLRRVHPIVAGTVFHDFDCQFMAEFGGAAPSIYDAYVNYHPLPEAQLEAGRFKTPFGLEWLQSASNLSFNERSLANNLVPLRDLGVELHGDLFGGRANYAAGFFNSVPDGANAANSDFDNEQEFIGRFFLQPFKKAKMMALQGLGFGVSGSYGRQFTSSALTGGFKTDGQQTFFAYTNGVAGNGAHWRVSPQAYYYYGPFSLMGEYVISDQEVKHGAATADLQNTAWEISGGWVFTGDPASYAGVTPRHPFDLHNGGWGAWQLVARYAGFGADDDAFPIYANPNVSASAAQAWAVGLNWWLNKNVRVMTSFSRTTFTGGATGAVTKLPEEVLFTRLQLSF